MPDSNISDSMAESIFNNEIIQNMTDETFDKILDVIGFTVPNILRDIPVFKYVVSLYSLSSDIIKCMEVKRQLRFLRELSKCRVNQEELNKRRIAYQNNEKWVYREIEQICLFISRSNDVNKSQIQAYLYISLVNKDIEYNDFVEYLQIVDMMLIEDVKELIDIFEQGKNHKYDYARCFRLQALGMLTGGITAYCGESRVDKFYLTDMSKGLCNMIMNKGNE